MATTDKDFKVKHGIQVADGGTFGGAVTVGEPTSEGHAVTKSYVDALVSNVSVPVTSTPPENAENGQLFFDSLSQRLAIFYNSTWISLATVEDAEDIPQHIHDTAIGGTGLVISRFYDAGFVDSAASEYVDGGIPGTTLFELTYDGGLAIDNFN